MFKRMSLFVLLTAALFFTVSAGSVLAADPYPSKAIRIIVASGVGGSIDRMSRSVQRFLPKILGVPVLVDNYKGAGGKIGLRYFLQQPADGYTLFVFLQPALTILKKRSPNLFEMKDLSYININWVDPDLIVANKDLGWKSLDDMIQAAKKNPGKYSFSLPSLFATGSIMGQLLFKRLGLNVKIAPYDSGGSARTAVRAHQVDMTAGGAEGMLTIEDVCTPLGVFWDKPVASWPNVPLINNELKKYNVSMPNGASIRFFATRTEFKKKYPHRWKILVDAFYKLVNEDKGFKAFCDKSQIGREWYGPKKATKLIMESDKVFKAISLKGK